MKAIVATARAVLLAATIAVPASTAPAAEGGLGAYLLGSRGALCGFQLPLAGADAFAQSAPEGCRRADPGESGGYGQGAKSGGRSDQRSPASPYS